jgi:DNA-binding XRE family transcriptional regulator
MDRPARPRGRFSLLSRAKEIAKALRLNTLGPSPSAPRRGVTSGRQAVTDQPALGFAWLLRQLRAEARLTQEELAEAAGLSPRLVSDLERGINRAAGRTLPSC